MHLIEWLVSAWPKRCLTATWTNLYLQGSGKVCEIHQKNVTTVAALYSRTDPAPPANNMTFLAAGGINDHNMQLYIPNIQYMSYLRPCPRVHSISLQQFFYSIYIYRKTLKKKLWNDEDWRTMPNPYPLVSTEPPRLQDLSLRSETIELLLSSFFRVLRVM